MVLETGYVSFKKKKTGYVQLKTGFDYYLAPHRSHIDISITLEQIFKQKSKVK